jgi:hypothetical protein
MSIDFYLKRNLLNHLISTFVQSSDNVKSSSFNESWINHVLTTRGSSIRLPAIYRRQLPVSWVSSRWHPTRSGLVPRAGRSLYKLSTWKLACYPLTFRRGSKHKMWMEGVRTQESNFNNFFNLYRFVNNFYSSPGVISTIKLKRMNWSGHVAWMGRAIMQINCRRIIWN